MKETVEISKALADESRIRVLNALHVRELCACEIIDLLELAASTVSAHMRILRNAGLVLGRKEGRWMHYRLPVKTSRSIQKAIEWVHESSKGSSRTKKDSEKLKRITKKCGTCS